MMCPVCKGKNLWDRFYGMCHERYCGFSLQPAPVLKKRRQYKEWIRTIAAVLSVILQSVVLHFVIKYHPR